MSFTNNQNKQKRVVQDQPAMRSVALSSISSTSTLDYAASSHSLLRTSHSYDGKLAFPTKNDGRSTSSQHDASASATTSIPRFVATPNHQLLDETTNTTVVGSWVVDDQALKGLPDWYPLERTHVAVFNASAQQIMDRIADCLREKSIAATLDDQKVSPITQDDGRAVPIGASPSKMIYDSPNTNYFTNPQVALQAETRDHIRFIVSLFRGDDKEDKNRSKVIVEVQRRSGCAFVFHQCSDAVLNAAQGIRHKSCLSKNFTIPDCVKQLAAKEAANESSSSSPEQVDEATKERLALEADLECALRLWKSDRYDAQLLGLESLVLLSSQQETKKHLATICAHSLLCTECVQKKLLSLVLLHSNHHDWAEECDALVLDHVQRMRRYALTVLANCLEALSHNTNHSAASSHDQNELQHVMDKNEALRSTDLMDVLVEALHHAERDPHDAHQAARCIGVLCRCCSMCKEHAMEMGATEAATKALDVGTVRHSLLEGASRQLQHEMGFS